MVRLTVRVHDVTGKEYTPPFFVVRYRVRGPQGETAPVLLRLVPGQSADVPAHEDVISLTVGTGAAGFSGETFTLRRVGTRWLTDTPAATVAEQGGAVSVQVVDGTLRLAPTVYLPPDLPVRTNPNALLCEPGQGWIYYGAYLKNSPIELLRNPIRFTQQEPERYPSDRKETRNEGSGQLVFLEYGLDSVGSATPGPRFLIGAWAPRVALGPLPQVVLFYTPPTKPDRYPVDAYPFRNAYPYSPFITPPTKPFLAKELVQPYPYLVINYLLAGHMIQPQILAAGRNPIIIFPVQPSQNWGPLATQSGAARLVKEVLRFLYARQLVSGRSGPVARLALDGGRASVVPREGLFTDQPIPASWALTISGFSNGFDQVLNLCGSAGFDEQRYDPAIFGSPTQQLLDSWREIWDVDGVVDNGTGAVRHLDTLRTWLKAGRRRVRSYHSSQGMRTAPRALVDASRIVSQPSPPYKGLYIEEGTSADGTATWMYFSDASLKGLGYDPHHSIPAIAFGHAAQFPLP